MISSRIRQVAFAAVAGILSLAAPAALAGQSGRPQLALMASGYAAYDHALGGRLLAAHNRERSRLRLPLLRWDPALAASAASYGPALAAIGGLRHSPRGPRSGQGENLWMGTRSAYTPEQMVSHWIGERRHFRAGVFPHITATGNWADVGHYSTMIWPTTTAVGCAVHRSARWDFLICRYSPRGNVDGRRVG